MNPIVLTVFILLFAGIFLVWWSVKGSDRIDVVQDEKKWQNAERISELLGMYLDVVFKHGPDSQEARAFRWGVDNHELKLDSGPLSTFREVVEIVDDKIRHNSEFFKKRVN